MRSIAHRKLHSFPTRRSSDLEATSRLTPSIATKSPKVFLIPRTSMLISCSRRCRSEEHTSELQSHSDLVCRLLLEKKNTDGNGPQAVVDQREVHRMLATDLAV